MDCTISHKNGVVVISPDGELDIYNSHALKQVVVQEIAMGSRKLLIDMARVDHMDSTALGVLVSSFKAARLQNARFKLTSLSGPVQRLMHLTRLTKFFEIHGSADEALASFS